MILRLTLRLLKWSDQSLWRRYVLIAGLVVIPGGAGALAARLGGPVVALGLCAILALFVWATFDVFPLLRNPVQVVEQRDVYTHRIRPAPCALCGYNCIPGGFWTPVPGYLNVLMHTQACGPVLPGEKPLTGPTHRRKLGGGYEPIG